MDADGQILYVGKAKNLKKRVTSYKRSPLLSKKIKKMTELARRVEHQVLDSEIEALLIEAELIKAHQPYFNSRLKDDKSNIYLLISKEKFPKILRVRKTDLNKKKYQEKLALFGPFASSYRLNELLKIIRPIFRWCNQAKQKQNKACLYHHIDLCSGACCQEISEEDYQKDIQQLILFLRGQKKDLLKELEKEMLALAKEEAFEKAQFNKIKILLIKEITSNKYKLKSDLILPNFSQEENKEALIHLRKILHQEGIVDQNQEFKRIEGYDVSNTMGQNATVSMVVLTNGEKDQSQYKFFKIRTLNTPNDYQMLQEALRRRQNHPEWGVPDLIMMDGGKGQVRAVAKIWQNHALVIGLVKNPDRLVICFKNQEKKDALETKIIQLQTEHPTLKMLQRLRDEAHRFAKKQHTRLREKNLLK
ncbi:GIY-YIG nuclease family protein [Patescibacteria group bacterium]|nr:GIY-YIG nuclease family protein [Patescibacteria group bacterium]